MTEQPEDNNRRLSDEDIAALASELEKRLLTQFYHNLGKGVWGVLWKATITAVLAIAAYDYLKR